MTKQKNKKNESKTIKPTVKIDYSKNLLTFAENKFLELEDDEQYREVLTYTFEDVTINKKGRKITIEKIFQSPYEKICRVKNEVDLIKNFKDGDYKGNVIHYEVIKKGSKKPTIKKIIVGYVSDNLIIQRK